MKNLAPKSGTWVRANSLFCRAISGGREEGFLWNPDSDYGGRNSRATDAAIKRLYLSAFFTVLAGCDGGANAATRTHRAEFLGVACIFCEPQQDLPAIATVRAHLTQKHWGNAGPEHCLTNPVVIEAARDG
jgi:hypothetical protein